MPCTEWNVGDRFRVKITLRIQGKVIPAGSIGEVVAINGARRDVDRVEIAPPEEHMMDIVWYSNQGEVRLNHDQIHTLQREAESSSETEIEV